MRITTFASHQLGRNWCQSLREMVGGLRCERCSFYDSKSGQVQVLQLKVAKTYQKDPKSCVCFFFGRFQTLKLESNGLDLWIFFGAMFGLFPGEDSVGHKEGCYKCTRRRVWNHSGEHGSGKLHRQGARCSRFLAELFTWRWQERVGFLLQRRADLLIPSLTGWKQFWISHPIWDDYQFDKYIIQQYTAILFTWH